VTREEWAQRSLAEASQRIRDAGQGRHTATYRGAAQVAPYVADGVLERARVERELLQAAVDAVGEARRAEAARTIADALARRATEPAWYPTSCGGGEWNRPVTVQWRGKVYRLAAGQRPSEVVEGWSEGPMPATPLEDGRVWVTLYPSDRITQGDGGWWGWDDLVEMVSSPDPWLAEGKRGLRLWAPTQVEGDDRGRRPDGLDSNGAERHRPCSVGLTHALVLDYDDDPSWSIDQVRTWWGQTRYVAHTTSSHNVPKGDKPAHARGRVVLALSRPVSEEEHAALARWALACGRGIVGSAELANVRRGYYVPSVAPGGYQSDAHLIDRVLDVDAILGATARLETESVDLSPDTEVWATLDLRPGKEGSPPRAADHNLNLSRILGTDPRWAGRIRRNLFTGAVEIDGRQLADDDETAAGVWFGEVYGVHPPTTRVHEVVSLVASRNVYHPVRDYLAGLTWDGTPRLHTWLAEYLGCPPDDTSAAIGTRWLIAAVARVQEPGCKVDEMLILKGAQGAGKSRSLRALCADPAWFSDTALPIGEKDAYQQLSGVWLYEIGELDSVRRTEWTAVKAFLSSQVDKYRASYGRNQVTVPRQVVFCGSTNEATFLGDSTGQRRFWVREIGRCKPEAVARDRDLLWAEALHLYRAGEQWHLTDKEAGMVAADTEQYRQIDPWEDLVVAWCDGRSAVSTREVLTQAIQRRPEDLTRADEMRAASLLASMGRIRRKRRGGWFWMLPES
jgi:hypothetical protein